MLVQYQKQYFNCSASSFFQIRDLLSESRNSLPKIHMGSNSFVDLAQEGVENPLDFSRVLKVAFQNRGTDLWKLNFSHLYVCILFLCTFSMLFLMNSDLVSLRFKK